MPATSTLSSCCYLAPAGDVTPAQLHDAVTAHEREDFTFSSCTNTSHWKIVRGKAQAIRGSFIHHDELTAEVQDIELPECVNFDTASRSNPMLLDEEAAWTDASTRLSELQRRASLHWLRHDKEFAIRLERFGIAKEVVISELTAEHVRQLDAAFKPLQEALQPDKAGKKHSIVLSITNQTRVALKHWAAHLDRCMSRFSVFAIGDKALEDLKSCVKAMQSEAIVAGEACGELFALQNNITSLDRSRLLPFATFLSDIPLGVKSAKRAADVVQLLVKRVFAAAVQAMEAATIPTLYSFIELVIESDGHFDASIFEQSDIADEAFTTLCRKILDGLFLLTPDSSENLSVAVTADLESGERHYAAPLLWVSVAPRLYNLIIARCNDDVTIAADDTLAQLVGHNQRLAQWEDFEAELDALKVPAVCSSELKAVRDVAELHKKSIDAAILVVAETRISICSASTSSAVEFAAHSVLAAIQEEHAGPDGNPAPMLQTKLEDGAKFAASPEGQKFIYGFQWADESLSDTEAALRTVPSHIGALSMLAEENEKFARIEIAMHCLTICQLVTRQLEDHETRPGLLKQFRHMLGEKAVKAMPMSMQLLLPPLE